MKWIIFSLLFLSSSPAFANDNFPINSINADNLKEISSKMEISIPQTHPPQKTWQKEQSEACRADWEHINSFLSRRNYTTIKFAELYKEWNDLDFVYLYFHPNVNPDEGEIETVYLHEIGLYDKVKNSAPSMDARTRMEKTIKEILKEKIKNNQLGHC